jgi:hypothetical protein
MFSLLPPLHQYALLDPKAYSYYFVQGWSDTVPEGATWYALNLWSITINGTPDCFHRKLHVGDALALPAGTTISNVGSKTPGFAYICKPESIVAPVDLASALSARLTALSTMPTATLRAEIPAGSPSGTQVGVLFPSNINGIMLRHTATMNGCWTILAGNRQASAITYDALNTLDEISDIHMMRLTGNTLCPLLRCNWNGAIVQAGNISGNPSETAQNGWSVVQYNQLPDCW